MNSTSLLKSHKTLGKILEKIFEDVSKKIPANNTVIVLVNN